MTDHVGTVLLTGDDHSALRYVRRLDTTVEDMWHALTDPARLAEWFTPTTIEPRLGGRVHVDFGADGSSVGEVVAWDPPRLLEYTWNHRGETGSRVRWEIAADGDGVLLTLTHTRMPTMSATGYGAGWHDYLDRLAGQTAADNWERLMPAYDGIATETPFAACLLEAEDRCALDLVRWLPADPTTCWEAITTSDGLAAWLAPGRIEPRIGGAVSIDFDEGTATGLVTEWDPPAALAFGWRFPGEPDSHLRITLAPDGGGTFLTLTHRLLAPATAADYGAGWHAHAAALERVVAGGDPAGVWATVFADVRPAYQQRYLTASPR